jgi:hypothetical protein
MKKLFVGILMVCLVLVMVGCVSGINATIDYKPLYVDFEYPVKDVWFEAFNIIGVQGLILEKGTFQEKYFVARFWDGLFPIVCVIMEFEKLSDNRTRIHFRYNANAAIAAFKLKGKIEYIMSVINTNLMARNSDKIIKPHKIHDIDIWLKTYNK